MQVVVIGDDVAAIAATVHDLSQEMDLVSPSPSSLHRWPVLTQRLTTAALHLQLTPCHTTSCRSSQQAAWGRRQMM